MHDFYSSHTSLITCMMTSAWIFSPIRKWEKMCSAEVKHPHSATKSIIFRVKPVVRSMTPNLLWLLPRWRRYLFRASFIFNISLQGRNRSYSLGWRWVQFTLHALPLRGCTVRTVMLWAGCFCIWLWANVIEKMQYCRLKLPLPQLIHLYLKKTEYVLHTFFLEGAVHVFFYWHTICYFPVALVSRWGRTATMVVKKHSENCFRQFWFWLLQST